MRAKAWTKLVYYACIGLDEVDVLTTIALLAAAVANEDRASRLDQSIVYCKAVNALHTMLLHVLKRTRPANKLLTCYTYAWRICRIDTQSSESILLVMLLIGFMGTGSANRVLDYVTYMRGTYVAWIFQAVCQCIACYADACFHGHWTCG